MNVVIYMTSILGVHFRTELELALKHQVAGDQVRFLTCEGDLQICPSNPGHDFSTCFQCKSKLRRGLALPAVDDLPQDVLDLADYYSSVPEVSFDSISDLKKFDYKGRNLGMAAASSVISGLKDPAPSPASANRHVERAVATVIATYDALCDYVRDVKPDRMYVLNGRRAPQMPALHVADQEGFEIFTYEVGHDANKYTLMKGASFLDLAGTKADIQRYWEDDTPYSEKNSVASEFYAERKHGSSEKFLEAQFKDGQRQGRLPSEFDASRRNIAVFGSSEDEFAAVEGYENPVYEDQFHALNCILGDEALSDELTIHFRVHPNLAGRQNSQTNKLKELDFPQLNLIPSTSEIDSYALMEACEKTLTFGSTMGIEAAYARIPSILVGRAPWEELGSCYWITHHGEVIEILNEASLSSLPIEGAVKYGYYMKARDRDYIYVDAEHDSLHGSTLEPAWYAKDIQQSSLRKDLLWSIERIRQGDATAWTIVREAASHAGKRLSSVLGLQ